ncbi:MAG: hypothetical protein HC894_10385 [Microcoleus sp. SM1_3_4]|nr:hypothetical protein [Microcoleus sp. SM1_3_4]
MRGSHNRPYFPKYDRPFFPNYDRSYIILHNLLAAANSLQMRSQTPLAAAIF